MAANNFRYADDAPNLQKKKTNRAEEGRLLALSASLDIEDAKGKKLSNKHMKTWQFMID